MGWVDSSGEMIRNIENYPNRPRHILPYPLLLSRLSPPLLRTTSSDLFSLSHLHLHLHPASLHPTLRPHAAQNGFWRCPFGIQSSTLNFQLPVILCVDTCFTALSAGQTAFEKCGAVPHVASVEKPNHECLPSYSAKAQAKYEVLLGMCQREACVGRWTFLVRELLACASNFRGS